MDYEKPFDLIGKIGFLRDFKKALLERVLGAELFVHFDCEVRKVQAHPREMYGTEVSNLISRVTDAVLEEVTA